MIKEAISKVIEKTNLTREQMRQVMDEIMSGVATPAQIAAFLVALRIKGETVDEITAAAEVMRQKALKLDVRTKDEPIVDTCGTGGEGACTFNVSTVSAFVVAGLGVKVAKHGNKAVSSSCGSADLMEGLGVNIELPPEKVAECVKKIGIGFLYAPLYHSAMKYATPVRREIGVRTIFNILGPLANPAGADVQVLGVYEDRLIELMASVLKNLKARHAFVVRGRDGLDEISITGKTQVAELKDGIIKKYDVSPEDFGLPMAKLCDVKGADVKENVNITLNILSGKEKGPKRDIVLMNVSAALVAAGKAKDFNEGVKLAIQSIESGSAIKKLEGLKEFYKARDDALPDTLS